MSIENTYRKLLIENYIKEQLSLGNIVVASDVVDQIETLIENSDLSTPQFVASDHYVTENESSSASAFRNTFLTMRQDLRVLYSELLALSSVNQKSFNRWDLEARSLEKRLVDLEDRIENLLLLTQNTEGYHSILVDNFTDTTLVDINNSDVEHDIASASVQLGLGNGSVSRIFLNDLDLISDINFKVRTTINMLDRRDAVGSSLLDIFTQEDKAWWTSIRMKKQQTVTCELNVRLDPDGPIDVSKIFLELHDAAESSPIHITPLYSIDNRNWIQLPTTTYTAEVRTAAVFTFKTVQAQYMKFLLTKSGPDQSSSNSDAWSYQFGFKNIMFYRQAFDVNTGSTLITIPLSILNTDGSVKEFEKVVLETCEKLETGTEINYFVTVSNDSAVPLDSEGNPTDGKWIPISPLQRVEKLHPYIISVGDVVETIIGDTIEDDVDNELLGISYDGLVAPLADDSPSPFTNPAAAFKLLYRNATTGAIAVEDRSASTEVRYAFVNSNERILNYQIKDTDSGVSGTGLNLDLNNIIIFRNVGTKRAIPGSSLYQVRDIQQGWRYEEPYYSCVIEIENEDGLEIDVGDQNIIIDDVSYSNIVSNTVLTGKTGIPGDVDYTSGVHTVKIHKNNWKAVTPELNSLTELKAADSLYPYNHKLLIEGYRYGDSYPDTDDQVYTGVDLFAETIVKQVSPFDMITNIAADNYDVFALDRDAPLSHDTPNDDNDSTAVVLVKVDENNPDFQNERFVLRFTLINELRKYLRLRVDMSTEDADISPTLHSYKIKLR